VTVRAKLFVSSIARQASTPDAIQVTFGAVTRGDDNKDWAEATPVAQFQMTIQNPAAAAQFSLGQEFYVDFSPAEDVATLATPHDYQPSEYERSQTDWGHGRCELCHCKSISHDEPVRSELVRLAGLS
jgi:hypothetical protein